MPGYLEVAHTKSRRVRRVPLSAELLTELRGHIGRLVPYATGSPGSFATRVLGHASITTTQRYARLSDEAVMREAARLVNDEHHWTKKRGREMKALIAGVLLTACCVLASRGLADPASESDSTWTALVVRVHTNPRCDVSVRVMRGGDTLRTAEIHGEDKDNPEEVLFRDLPPGRYELWASAALSLKSSYWEGSAAKSVVVRVLEVNRFQKTSLGLRWSQIPNF